MAKKLGSKRKNRVKPGNWDVFVATPAYDGKVDTDYCQALAEASFCAPLFGLKVNQSVMGNGAFIDLARNTFVKIFLEKFPDATHLFFIDADLKFPAQPFIEFVRADLPIVAGVYPRRQSPPDYPVKWAEHPKEGGLWVEEHEGMHFVMAERVPTGFLCIRRDVIEAMAKDAPKLNIHGQEGTVPRLFYTYIDDENRFIGEDYAFCDDYRKRYGKPIHVYADIDFKHGGYEGNLLKFLEEKIEAEEAA